MLVRAFGDVPKNLLKRDEFIERMARKDCSWIFCHLGTRLVQQAHFADEEFLGRVFTQYGAQEELEMSMSM